MIILDTHAWIWWVTESDQLSPKALEVIENSAEIGVPAICCWEMAMLEAKKRIGLSIDVQVWIDLALQREKVKLIPLTPEIAVLSTRLPGDFHGDPADRLIVASGLLYKAPLVTKDQKISYWKYARVIW